jgi:DNA repair and recombination protein RAD52
MSTQQEEEMFTEKQIQALRYNLDGSRVKTRQQGNINLSYLEGYDLIDTANTVFGFGNWSYSISTLNILREKIAVSGRALLNNTPMLMSREPKKR